MTGPGEPCAGGTRHHGIPESSSAGPGEVGDETREHNRDLEAGQGGGSHQQALNAGEDGPHLFWVLERLAGWQWGNRLAGPGLAAERPEESRAAVPTKEKWVRE